MSTKLLISGSFVVACLFSAPAAFAQVSADTCPPMGFLNTANHVLNPSFEVADHGGTNHSAAAKWFVHTDNQNDPISTSLVTTTVPHGTDPGEGKRMIHVDAVGNESGVYQVLPVELIHSKLMFSAWVYVKTGHVTMQLGSFVGSPNGWSTKHNQWEELRVCSNGNPNAPAQDSIFIVNEDPTGGHFAIDRVEVRETQ